jgi:hypothetical protein
MMLSNRVSFQGHLSVSPAVVAPLFSVVSFRDMVDIKVFQQIERRLCRREADRFAGYAEQRHQANPLGLDILTRVESAVAMDPRWAGLGRLLYNLELEVWMDLSRANETAMMVYGACLDNGIPFYVRSSGPFTPLFCQLLLQKNGFERVCRDAIPPEAVELDQLLSGAI